MVLIAGLGNPGVKYAATRHNFGFWALDDLAAELRMPFRPGKGDYLYAERTAGPVLIKPTAYMNDSGLPLKEALAFFDMATGDALVVLDEIDLPLGSLRFRPAGGSGGHKGLESVLYHLGTDQIPRLRLGIATNAPLRPSEEYVLQPFRPEDGSLVKETRTRAVEALKYFMANGIEPAMTHYNARGSTEASGKANVNESG